ncbi:MAG: hypothetical protein R2939_08760 [Kofleriaceae bacterium]
MNRLALVGRRRSATASAVFGGLCAAALLTLTGCPENPYKASTWIGKLGDRQEAARAVVELDRLGDPAAIEPLARHWEENGKDIKVLDAIISLAAPIVPDEVAVQVKPKLKCKIKGDQRCFILRDFPEGRPASWDKAMPVLRKVLTDVDDLDDRWRDSASKAAAAIGQSQDPEGIDVLVEIINRKMNAKAAR